MRRVKISELKAHLSEYVAAARRGETVIVCDRNTPVAKLEPLDEVELLIREPTVSGEERQRILDSLTPIPLAAGTDVQAILDDMRAERF